MQLTTHFSALAAHNNTVTRKATAARAAVISPAAKNLFYIPDISKFIRRAGWLNTATPQIIPSPTKRTGADESVNTEQIGDDATEMSIHRFLGGDGDASKPVTLQPGMSMGGYLKQSLTQSFIIGLSNKLHIDVLKNRLPTELACRIEKMVKANEIQLIQLTANWNAVAQEFRGNMGIFSRNHTWCRQDPNRKGSWLVCPIGRNPTNYGPDRIELPKAKETLIPGNTILYMPREPFTVLLPEWK